MNDIAKGGLPEALARMNEALRILDESDVSGDVGGHLDLAIARLQERLGGKRPLAGALEEDMRTPKDASLEADKAGQPACARVRAAL